jgi:dipeptidyl aminopeptidase/acylaminoacyl peptidase
MRSSHPARRSAPLRAAGLLAALFVAAAALGAQERSFSIDDAARLSAVAEVEISPDGERIAYTLSVPRVPFEDEDGPAWSHLYVVGPEPGSSRLFIGGEAGVSQIAWAPGGQSISFLAKRGDDEHAALYLIPVDGGEARKLVAHETDISSYSWSPDGRRVAFLAVEKADAELEALAGKGIRAEAYEEGLLAVQVWLATIENGEDTGEHRLIGLEGSASELHWSPVGDRLAVALAPTSAIDDFYMLRDVHVVDTESGEITAIIDNPGKLGRIGWSPDGQTLAMLAGADPNDPGENRLMVAPVTGGVPTEILPGYEGDFVAFAFESPDSILYAAHEGVEAKLGAIRIDAGDIEGGGDARPAFDESAFEQLAPPGGPILRRLSLAAGGRSAAFLADSPTHPPEVYRMTRGGSEVVRMTDSNPWLAARRLADQEVVGFAARDGLEVEGILIRPLDYQPGQRYPLILSVHGGPESHHSNGWLTSYSSPGQYAAAEGYAVFYTNYRGSTGRGVAYSKLHQADYAGGEFNDLVDAVKHLVGTGLVDERKVGVTGGSYGGYASAWCATALTEHFAAAVMFVGISDQISKFGTTDIPNEMFMVHSRRLPWESWDWMRERSPIYHVEKARTPILIVHGKDDTRVHPGQSLELYRYLKMLGNVPVRLVWYPGEGHGNRNAGARYDYSRRLMRWMDHYLEGPGGEPPPYKLDYPQIAEEGDGQPVSERPATP